MLSVVIPVYNAGETLQKCLEAVKSSKYFDYELIVVDDGSSDDSAVIAEKYADQVIRFSENTGRVHARRSGWRAAKGDIIINIDSDVMIQPDSLGTVADYFQTNPDTDAVTGRLSKKCPCKNFFSLYKHLYMNYIFGKLSKDITFLYGSIFAIRKALAGSYPGNAKTADDTELGQELSKQGKGIVFLESLQVAHCRKYAFLSLMKNDFKIPFDWAGIFLRLGGWKQLFRNQTGFAHSPKEQILSVILAPFLVIFMMLKIANLPILLVLSGMWLVLNFKFLVFLTRERGLWFGFRALFVTFLDHLVMAAGIFCGTVGYLFKKSFSHEKP